MLGRPGIYFPTPADGGIGFDASKPMAGLVVGVHPATAEQNETVDIIVFTNISEQLGGVTAKRGIAIGTEQGQFAPYQIVLI